MRRAPVHYTAGQVGLACFIGSPLAASWLMARTYRAAGEAGKGRLSLVWGVLATLCLLALAFVLPEDIPQVVLPAAVAAGAYFAAQQLQAPIVAGQRAAGGRQGSWWAAAGIGVLGGLILVAVLLVIAAV